MIWQMIEDWFRGILTDGILSNLSGLFDSVNTEVGEIATQVGTTPAGWNAGIFNMIRSLSENVIVPIAGVIITFVMCYELIQLVIEKNNLHDLDTWMVLAMLPMFLLAMYEKNGQPLEVIIRQFVEVKFLRPKERPYQTNNFYTALARQERLDKEVRAIVKGKGKDPKQKA